MFIISTGFLTKCNTSSATLNCRLPSCAVLFNSASVCITYSVHRGSHRLSDKSTQKMVEKCCFLFFVIKKYTLLSLMACLCQIYGGNVIHDSWFSTTGCQHLHLPLLQPFYGCPGPPESFVTTRGGPKFYTGIRKF